MTTFSAFLVFVLAVVACPAAEPLSLKKLQEIIETDHADKPLVEALQIYPQAREYKIAVTNRTPDGQVFEGKAKASEKWVEGRFIVSEAQPAGPETKFAMIVEYDSDKKLYRKYVVMGGEITGCQIGTRIGKSRSVSWIDLSPMKFEPKMDNLTTETHTDDKTTWQSIFFQNGELQRAESGVATVTKR